MVSIKDGIPVQIDYLKKADLLTSRFVKKLGKEKSELLTDKAGGHYAHLQKEFENAFPGYDLGYMIGYGAYELVNSKLKAVNRR